MKIPGILYRVFIILIHWNNYNDSLPDDVAKRHGINSLFVMALDDVLRENLSKNAIEWVERCARQPISDLPRDIRRVLRKMPPVKRKKFYSRTVQVLDGAVQHFSR